MERVVLLKQFKLNKKGTYGYLSEMEQGFFVFNGFRISREAVVDSPDLFKIEESNPICETAPYPQCNGAEGCDTCEHQEEE